MTAGQHAYRTSAAVTGKRRKIEIKRIERQSSLYVAFSKRRNGLFGKLDKFCRMSPPGTEAAVVTFSPVADKVHERGGSHSVEPVLGRFLEHVAAKERSPEKRRRTSMMVREVEHGGGGGCSGGVESVRSPEKRRRKSVVERREEDHGGGGYSGGEESTEEARESEAALLRVKMDVEMRLPDEKVRELRTRMFF